MSSFPGRIPGKHKTAVMQILTTQVTHAGMLSDYYLRNQARFKSWQPRVREEHHSLAFWERRLRERARDFQEGRAVHFIGIEAEGENEKVIGACSLTNILYSPACFCYMGYSVDADYEGQGVMTRIVEHAIDYAFNTLRMNRISANYMPANTRSARLLEKLGFEKEGYAKRYLFINGRWEDHILTSLINPGSEKSNSPGAE